MTGISIALSGGGHRATMFGLGVLLYLSKAAKSSEVVSISSVSGGSITNGFTAQEVDYSHCTKEEFESRVAAPLASQVARRGTLYAPLESKLYLALLVISAAATLLVPWFLASPWFWRVTAFVLLLLWTAWVAKQRGRICGLAYRKTLFSPGGKATSLSSLKKGKTLDHVFCSTDLATARQFYMSPNFLYGYGVGWTPSTDLPLHRVVLASACFPGGFPPTLFPTAGRGFRPTDPTAKDAPVAPSRLVLVDGGVYDNMGDQWARGFAARRASWPALKELQTPPGTLIVVNSSARLPWKDRDWIPVWGELAAFLRDVSVMYENTTTVRRQDLVHRFAHAERGEGDLDGALVMIRQSPFDVADLVHEHAPDSAAGQRAKAMIAHLGEGQRDSWRGIAQENSGVKTTLKALDVRVSAQLVRQGYVLAMANLNVILGYPTLPVPTQDQFERLARGGRLDD